MRGQTERRVEKSPLCLVCSQRGPFKRQCEVAILFLPDNSKPSGLASCCWPPANAGLPLSSGTTVRKDLPSWEKRTPLWSLYGSSPRDKSGAAVGGGGGPLRQRWHLQVIRVSGVSAPIPYLFWGLSGFLHFFCCGCSFRKSRAEADT